ncbi:MAG TPA: c-type cytochrome [Thermomicrobiales bacterium]|nr:c-type cytochrome [Thermomicrobiales bacterium]
MALVLSVILTPSVSASVAPTRITPADGELMTSWPETIEVTFADPIDPASSTIQLLDTEGQVVPDATSTMSDDEATLSIAPPAGLANGTYTIVWDVRPGQDDEASRGYSAFTVGTAADGSVVTVPSTSDAPGGPSPWLQGLARGASLLGMVILVAIWPAWTLVLRPALAAARSQARQIVQRGLRFTTAAVALALAGSIFDLVIHAQSLPGGTTLDRIMDTIGQTRWGYTWTARVALIIALGVTLGLASWWFPRRNALFRWLIWIPVLILPLTFSLASHAWNPPVGRAAAVASNAVHGIAASIWAGTVILLLGLLVPSLRTLPAEKRREVIARTLPRFGILTLATWLPLAFTGAYAAWLQIGNRAALMNTDYGQAAIMKFGAVGLLLVTLVIGLFLARRYLAWVLGIQAVLIGVIVIAAGLMATTPPARDVVIERATQIEIPVMLGDRASTLLIAPGTTGINHLRLEVPGQRLPTETIARIHVNLPGNPEIGEKDILLSRVSGNNFEHHGTEFSLDGEWDILVGLTRPNMPEVTQQVSHDFGQEMTEHDVPGTPWRFHTTGGVSALALLLVGIGGVIVAVFAGRTPLRKEAGGLGAAALALGVVILLQARFDPILAGSGMQSAIDPNDLLMVERGELVYNTSCISCHGADLRGDGPLADTMDPPPADFSAPHTYVHTDEDLIYWIVNGKQNTGMPAFGDQLTDQEIRDVLAFIKNRQQEMGK